MKVKIVRIDDDYVINVRYTDELMEDGTLADEDEIKKAEHCIQKVGRYYLNATLMLIRA